MFTSSDGVGDMRVMAFVLMMASALPGPLAAQTISLREALARAAEGAFANRSAAGDARARAAAASASLRGVLPAVRLEGGYTRTTDPLGAFGFRLRQRAVTPEAFDPARLNYPDAIGNVAAGAVVEQPLFNADALFGRRAALRAADAASASEAWVRSGTQVGVIGAYYGAVLAHETVQALDTAFASALAHQRQAESMHRNGVVTRSDALLAAVRAAEVEARLIGARGDSSLSGARLALAIGAPLDSVGIQAVRLPDVPLVRAFLTAPLPAEVERPDVRAARLGLDAARADARRASALFLPRINAFGRLDWNAAGTPFGGDESWTAGVMVSWSPFSGGAELAEGRAARARRESAEAMAEAAGAQAQLDVRSAETRAAVALARMDLAERAVAQSIEAHRIVARKYEGGVASVTELFDAAAAETGARLAFAEARYQAIMAAAERLRARGGDVSAIVTLEDAQQ
jgi:outer membrane protein TolC